MKKFILQLVIIVAANLALQAQNNIIDEVVWVVGDEAILKSDVESQRLQALYQGQKFNGDPYCVIPEQIAVQKLFLHQAELDSIIVTDNDIISTVDRQINYMIAQLGSKEKLEEYFGKPLSKIREEQREIAREERTIDMMKESLLENVTVTPAEVRAYFKNVPSDSMVMIPAEVEVELITIEPEYDPQEIEEIKSRLREYTDRVHKGERFSTLAVLYSECASAKDGGELGFKGKGEYVPEFANVAFNLTDPTKVSRIVETQFGFHIIQLIEKRGDRINCRHILLRPHISATEKNKAMLRLDSIADAIRNDKVSFKNATRLYSQDKDTRNNGGLLINPYTGTSRFQMEQLPQEIGKLVYNMNVGEISEPFTMVDTRENRNREICAIVRVKSKTKAHPASVTEDFIQLKDIVLQHKKEKIIEDWIREKQQEIYVRINENWRSCEFMYPGWIKQ
ncbi:MAG: peptidylprolyl isomerase [Bacteroidales bacterium]|nr:peptidylprolyl isomerase [Bacteroidales bacterium]